MKCLSFDELGVILKYLDVNDLISISTISKYYSSYYCDRKEGLLKTFLNKSTGFLTDNYTLKQLCILLKNHRFGQKRIAYLYPNLVIKEYSKVLSGVTYYITLSDDEVIIKEILNGDVKTIKGKFLDIANSGNKILLLSEDKVDIYYGRNYGGFFLIKNIKQIEASTYCDFLLSNDGIVYKKEEDDISIMDFKRKVIKIHNTDDFVEVLYEDNTTSKNIVRVIDLFIYNENSIYLSKDGDVYFSGLCKKIFFYKYFGLEGSDNRYSYIETPMKMLGIENIIAIHCYGSNLVFINKDNKCISIDMYL
jgi:hypothetical protein